MPDDIPSVQQRYRPNLLYETVLKETFEATMILDRDVRHETITFAQNLKAMDATRDVMVIFIRRPLIDGSDLEEVVYQKSSRLRQTYYIEYVDRDGTMRSKDQPVMLKSDLERELGLAITEGNSAQAGKIKAELKRRADEQIDEYLDP